MSLDERGNPLYLKMRVIPNLKQASVKKFAHTAFADGSVIYSDGYCSYIPALEGYTHQHKSYDPDSGLLHWLHIVISNAKAFIGYLSWPAQEESSILSGRVFFPLQPPWLWLRFRGTPVSL